MWVIHTVPGVDLSAEERNGRWQILDEKRKNKTRDGFGIPGLLAEPTGTDGFPVLCHQFAPSSLSRRETCIKSSTTFSLKMNKLREALLLFSSIGGQGRETRQMGDPLPKFLTKSQGCKKARMASLS